MSTKSHSSAGKGVKLKNNNNSDAVELEDKKELIKTGEMVSQISHSCLSDPDPNFNNTKSEKVEGGSGRVQRRRRSACSLRIGIGEIEVGGSNFRGNDCLMEIENRSEVKTTRRKKKFTVKTRLKEVSNCLTTSKELVRVLTHVWGSHDEKQPSSASSLMAALKSELDRAKTRVEHLMRDEQRLFHGDEIEALRKRFAEEKAAWKYKERARVGSAISSMAEEVAVERKLRRQAERLNKRIGKELGEARVAVAKAMKDVDREKRAKEILEEICEELAKGIGEDRAEFEELRKESEKVREEVEKEREMLQLADVLREERVQMKLSEAKYQFEEKNAAVERLKDQLEAYFVENRDHSQDSFNNKLDKIKELEAYLKKINFGSYNKNKEEEDCNWDEESDLHSIELNMDNNNKSYRWSFVHGSHNASKRNSFEKERKSLSEKIQWGSICFNSSSKNGEFEGDGERDGEIQITHKQKSGGVRCLRDILFPVSGVEENKVEKTEDAMPLQIDEPCSVVVMKG
ncbi:uncharacterized protein LOC111020667 isoform X2 [Momordica charantia]|nr:uncharacterized protein LOC111020667 isoform X2 [Momordica charantia]XP_022153079.1 uncharacterized protein LOC111020667 isoform X2 [Momordica charantia]